MYKYKLTLWLKTHNTDLSYYPIGEYFFDTEEAANNFLKQIKLGAENTSTTTRTLYQELRKLESTYIIVRDMERI